MSSYHTPGVYIQEVSTGAKPITQKGMGTAGFIGIAPDKHALRRWCAKTNPSFTVNLPAKTVPILRYR